MKILLLLLLIIPAFGQHYEAREVKQTYVRLIGKPKTVYVVNFTTNQIIAVCPSYASAVDVIGKQTNSLEFANFTRKALADFKLFPNTKEGNAALKTAITGLGCG